MYKGDWQRFSSTVGAPAVPRWSHRDPLEGYNPFRSGDRRGGVWKVATETAVNSLRSYDEELEVREKDKRDHDVPYSVRVEDLAIARFDTWAKRELSVVVDDETLNEYKEWLDRYVTNWLTYVDETFPKLEIYQSLSDRLFSRSLVWIELAHVGIKSYAYNSSASPKD